MTHEDFIERAKTIVKDYAIDHLDLSDPEQEFDVYVVWSCKTLQNSKALLSTTLHDGMYYETTLDGDRLKIYFDAYKKFQNISYAV